jgi:tetratricopeptide (TPR) repeat protein
MLYVRRGLRYIVPVTRPLALILAVALFLTSVPFPAAAQTTEADVYVAQGVLDFDEKKFPDALANFRRALEIEADHVEALYYIGVVNMAERRPAEAVPFLERARAKAPADASVAYQLGLAYFAQQQYDKAQPLLEEVFRATPAQDSLGYYVGFMRYRTKDYRGAVSAFRAGRSSDPAIQQLSRFYTGLALAVLGLPTQATAEVEQAMSLAPSSALTGPAERLRNTLVAQRKQERRFSAEARVGVYYDDNVAVIPNPAGSSKEPLIRPLRHPKSQSSGELAAVRADYVWLRTESFDATVGYSFFTTYNNDLPSFNVMDHLGSLGLTYKTAFGTMPAQVGVNYAYDALFLAQDLFVQRHTGSLIGAIAEDDINLTQIFFRVQDKDFENGFPQPEDRDAKNYMMGFLHLFRFAQDKHLIKLGFQQDYEYADGRDYTYQGQRIQAGAQYTLPWWSLRAKWDFDVHFRQYQNTNLFLPTTRSASVVPASALMRRDQEVNNIVRLELPLPQRLTLSGEFQVTHNRSNLQVFDYSRSVVSLILSWNY